MKRGGNGFMGRVKVEVSLVNHADVLRAEDGTIPEDQVRRVRATGVVDTGATYLVIPKKMASQLGLSALGQAKVRYADNRRAVREIVGYVEVELLGRKGMFKAIAEPRRNDVLIGAIVLEDLDLLVDCQTQTLHPRDPRRIITEIE